MWSWLPPELCRAILNHLPLTQLRLLKTLSRATASHCRAVLRSEAWQVVPNNKFALEEELKTRMQSYKLPLTVSCFWHHFPKNAPCLATIHHLKLVRLNGCGVLVTDKAAWEVKDRAYADHTTIITDMCIEVHGYGICGSEATLRQALQRAIFDRGDRQFMGTLGTTKNLGRRLWPYVVEADPNDDGDGDLRVVSINGFDEVPLDDVLQEMCIVTEVRKGHWAMPDPPPSLQGPFDGWGFANPLHLCQLGSQLFI
tara:strand:+ start:1766 stop:2530 length:765 start_codon:yes stop_codon:yes gene_type:complete